MTTENTNMKFWNNVKTPPADAIKPIKGGRLKGKSDINPQWRIEAMTEYFGMCGVGWKYEVTKQWFEAGANGNVAAFVNINLFTKNDGEWSDPIPGSGGSLFVEKESAGLHTSDEALKMATTDALSVAMKMLGVAAEVYKGNMDGSKYQKQQGTGQKEEMTGTEADKIVKKLQDSLKKCDDVGKTSAWWKSKSKDRKSLPPAQQEEITAIFTEHKLSFYVTCNAGEKPVQKLISECDGMDCQEKCPEFETAK